MEASALKHAGRRGLLARRSPLLRLQGDERLIAMIRAGHDRAFEVLFDRYHARLLAFCRHMLGSSEDAEDVLQEVFTNAHAAILGDERAINVRPWLYRIARNRCLNHLRKPVPEGQDSMDVHAHDGGTTTAERVQRREDFRALVADVQDLPETQRTALLLREIDALSYEEIAESMDTTVPAVKSLLVRARMSLAEATQSRVLSCGDVQLELAEVAEGLRRASGPVRHHVRRCDECRAYRSKLRSNRRELAALAPAVLIVWLHKVFGASLFGLGNGGAVGGSAAGAAGAGAGGAAGGTGAVAAGGAAAGGTGAVAAGGAAAAGGVAACTGAAAGGAAGGLGGVLCTKAVAGLATAALVTAGAVEVRHLYNKDRSDRGSEAPAMTQGAPDPQGTAPVGALAAGDLDQDRDGESAGRDEGGERSASQHEPAPPDDEAGSASADAELTTASSDEELTGKASEGKPKQAGDEDDVGADEKASGRNGDGKSGRRASGSQVGSGSAPEAEACESTNADGPGSDSEQEPGSEAEDPQGSLPVAEGCVEDSPDPETKAAAG